jgi:uncharacterized PurR-regulated membrane protein YhhQ (DUF165 family)
MQLLKVLVYDNNDIISEQISFKFIFSISDVYCREFLQKDLTCYINVSFISKLKFKCKCL